MNSLRARILLSFTLTTAIVVGVLGAWHYNNVSRFLHAELDDRVRTYTRFLARQAVSAIYTENQDELAEMTRNTLEIPLVSRVLFLRSDGVSVVWQQASPGNLLARPPAASEPPNAAAFCGSEPIVLPAFSPDQADKHPGSLVGFVNIELTPTPIGAQLHAVLVNIIIMELILLLGSLLLIVLLERWVTGPLTAMTERVRRMAHGDLAIRVEIPQSQDEVATLCRSINQMADALEMQTQQLEATVEEKTRAIEQRERQMMYQEKMASLGRISASIAHEINNPLNFISLGLDFLESQKPRSEEALTGSFNLRNDEVWAVVRDIRRGASRVRGIVDSLRGFARHDEERRYDYEMHALIAEVLQMYRHDLEQNEVDLTTDITFTGTINGSPLRANQILVNLMGNALDALRENDGPRRLQIRLWADGEVVHLAVDDNGPGVAVENRTRLFEPFFTTKPPGKGTGLGLALSFEMASREGGRLRFDPAGPLGGATFAVSLPQRRPRATPSPPRDDPAATDPR